MTGAEILPPRTEPKRKHIFRRGLYSDVQIKFSPLLYLLSLQQLPGTRKKTDLAHLSSIPLCHVTSDILEWYIIQQHCCASQRQLWGEVFRQMFLM